MLSAADQGIGNVTDALKSAGLWDDALVIFTTDNGGPTDACCVTGASNCPKRGGKCSAWEGGTTGDGLISGPAFKKMGFLTNIRFPHLSYVVDWLPTLADLLNIVPRGKDLDGKSQLESLMQGFATRDELFVGCSLAVFETGEWYGPAVRYRNWKIVQGSSGGPDKYDPKPKGSKKPLPGGLDNSTYLLFDLNTDPTEEANLADQYPFVLEIMIHKLKLYQKLYVPQQPDDDPNCPFNGLVNTTIGNDKIRTPTWMPRCRRAKEIVVYE